MNTSAVGSRNSKDVQMTPTELRKIAFGGKVGPPAKIKNPSSLLQSQTKATSTGSNGFCSPSIFLSMAICLTLLLTGNRNYLVDLWSPSANIFALIGMPVNMRGLEITNLRSVLVDEDGLRSLTVEGDIKNIADSSLKVPDLDMNIRSSAAHAIYSWRTPSPRSTLNKGETMTFRTRLAAPPDGAAEVQVRFSAI
jgi:hypothetical protein